MARATEPAEQINPKNYIGLVLKRGINGRAPREETTRAAHHHILAWAASIMADSTLERVKFCVAQSPSTPWTDSSTEQGRSGRSCQVSKKREKKSKGHRKRTTLSWYHPPSMVVRCIPQLPIVLLRSWGASSPMTELAWIWRKSTAFQTGSLRQTAHDAKVLLDQSGIFLMTYTKCTYSPPTQHEDKIVDGTVVAFFYIRKNGFCHKWL